MKQLAAAQSLLGYSLLARPLAKRFWRLSVWGNEDALRAFVQHPPHQRIMAALSPHMDKTEFVRWAVKGADPPALGRCTAATSSLTRAITHTGARVEREHD